MNRMFLSILTIIFLYIMWFIYENFLNKNYQDYKNNVNKNLSVAIINLDRASDRMKKMKQILDEYGFENIKKIKAVDGNGIKNKDNLEDYDGLSCLGNKDQYINQAACYLSHLRALKYAIDSTTEWTLIFEDDATFSKTPKSIMKTLSNIINSGKYDAAWLSNTNTSECYLLNKKCAKEIYGYLNQQSDFMKNFSKNYKKDCPHDWALEKAFKKINTFYSNNFATQRCEDKSYITNGDNIICGGGKFNKIYRTITYYDYY